MMKKLLHSFGVVLFLLVTSGNTFAQKDFDVYSPTTDPFEGLCYPIQTGKSIKVPIKVTCNMTKIYQPYTVSIDIPSSFFWCLSWAEIDDNSQSVDSSQTITFNLTIKPLESNTKTLDGQYPFTLNFNVYNKDNTHLYPSFTPLKFMVIVDNSAPAKPVISLSSRTSTSISIKGCSSSDPGNLSNYYSLVNDTAGIGGIRSMTFLLKKSSDNSIVQSSTLKYKDTKEYFTFSKINPGTSYTIAVTATDLAGNPSASSPLIVSTLPPPPPAPTNLTVSSASFCSITLAWTASPTATSYNVYNAAAPSTIIASTPFTSFSATGLTIGTTYSFFVKAVNEVGISLPSSTLAATTQSAPPISGPYRVCASGATFKVYGLPSGCTITWNQSFNLVRVSASGYSAKFASNGNGSAWIDATVKTPSCGSIPLPRLTVLALGTSLRITAKRISAVGEPYVVLFTAPADGHTSYTWYVNGSSQGETGSTFDLYIPCGISKTVKCESSNFCGSWETSNSITIKGPCDRDLSYTVSPNPASSTVTVSAVSPRVATDSTGTTYPSFTFVKVYDFQGNLKKSLKYSDANSVAIDVAGLKGGSYLFEVGNAEYTEKHQVLISR